MLKNILNLKVLNLVFYSCLTLVHNPVALAETQANQSVAGQLDTAQPSAEQIKQIVLQGWQNNQCALEGDPAVNRSSFENQTKMKFVFIPAKFATDKKEQKDLVESLNVHRQRTQGLIDSQKRSAYLLSSPTQLPCSMVYIQEGGKSTDKLSLLPINQKRLWVRTASISAENSQTTFFDIYIDAQVSSPNSPVNNNELLKKVFASLSEAEANQLLNKEGAVEKLGTVKIICDGKPDSPDWQTNSRALTRSFLASTQLVPLNSASCAAIMGEKQPAVSGGHKAQR